MEQDQFIVQRAAELGNRMRLLQVDMADQSAAERQGHMTDVLERGLKSLTPEQRRAVVSTMTERFPSWDSNVQIGAPHPPAGPAPVESVMDSEEVHDPSFLIARLIEVSRGMTPGQRQSAAGELKKAGFVLEGEAGLPEGPARALQSVLGHGPRDQLDPGRVVEMAAALALIAIKLDTVVPDIWKKLAPTSRVRKGATLKVTLSRFAAGDRETVRKQVDEESEVLRKIILGITSVLGTAALQFAREHLGHLDPVAIEQEVRVRGGFGIEQKCWKEFQRRAALNDVEAVERSFLAVLVREAERIMK